MPRFFFFSSRRRHTRSLRDWSSDVCSSDLRKPLVVFTPKSLLRHPAARSVTDEFVRGHFLEVLPDPRDPKPEDVRAVLLASGKFWYELDAHREKQKVDSVALVRVEQ